MRIAPDSREQNSEQTQSKKDDDTKVDTLTLERKIDPVQAAMDKVKAQLLSHDPKAALDMLRELRDHQTFEGAKLKLSPNHLKDIESQMQDLVLQLNPDDPAMQMAMFKTLKLNPPALDPNALAPVPTPAPQPAMRIGFPVPVFGRSAA